VLALSNAARSLIARSRDEMDVACGNNVLVIGDKL